MIHLRKILTLISFFMLISVCYSQDEVNYFNPNNIVNVPAGQLGISRKTGPVYFDFAEIDNNNLTISAGTSVLRVLPQTYNRNGSWSHNNGNGTFSGSNTFYNDEPGNQNIRIINGTVFVDVNGDGKNDFVMVKSNTMQIHLNYNNTINGIYQDIGAGAGIYVDNGSFDKWDGISDVAVLTGSTVNIFKNTFSSNGLETVPYSFNLSGSKIKIVQMNDRIDFQVYENDRDDIIIINGTNLKIYLNNNNNGIISTPFCDLNVGFNINDIDVGDLDADGYNDILLSGGTYPNYTAKYYHNVQGSYILESPVWSISGSYPTIGTNPLVTIGDVNRDGKNDIVVTGYEGYTKLFINNYGFSTIADQTLNILNPESVPHQIKLADIYNTGGQALVVSYSNPAFQNEHYGIRCANATTFDMNPVPPIIEESNYFDGSQYRPKLIFINNNDRDFQRYDIYKYSPNTGGQVIYLASTNSGEYIDYTEFLLPPGDGPNWNCYYYAKSVDQTSHVSLPSNYAHYWVGTQGGCDGCGDGDNFLKTGNNNLTPNEFSISNYPNPFNPLTVIYYSVPQNVFVNINVYNMLGQKIKSLVNGYKESGNYSVSFDGSDLSSGIYYYRIEAGDFIQSKKMILIK